MKCAMTGFRFRELLAGSILGLFMLGAQAAPTVSETMDRTHGGHFADNDVFFQVENRALLDTLRSMDLAVRCDLIKPVDMTLQVQTSIRTLLRTAQQAYGDKKGNISPWGGVQFYRAVAKMEDLDEQLMMAHGAETGNPSSADCAAGHFPRDLRAIFDREERTGY